MPTLVIRHPEGSEIKQPLSGELTVGRLETCDLVLESEGVSRRHARLWLQGGQVLVEDLDSANGTFLDGKRVSRPTVLRPGSKLALGRYELWVEAPAPPSAHGAEASKRRNSAEPTASKVGRGSAEARRPAPAPSGPHRLRGLSGTWAERSYALSERLLVGRWPPADVLLEDESVSRQHAELELTTRGVVLRDLDSANGTVLNGERVGPQEEVLLQPGDVLRFGRVELVYESSEPPHSTVSRSLESMPVDSELAPRRTGALRRLLVGLVGLVLLLAVAAAIFKVSQGSAWEGKPWREVVDEGVHKVLAKVLGKSPDKGPDKGPEKEAQTQVAAPPPPAPEPQSVSLEELVKRCRTYASTAQGATPDWARAEEACNKALDISPIHKEAKRLWLLIHKEKEAAELLSRAKAALETEAEKGLELLRTIPKDSTYFGQVQSLASKGLELAQQQAMEDCQRLVDEEQWKEALERCERYMSLACQEMKRSELGPPPGRVLTLRQGQLRRKEWRPKDPLYLGFLIARKKVTPKAPPWSCPPEELLAFTQ